MIETFREKLKKALILLYEKENLEEYISNNHNFVSKKKIEDYKKELNFPNQKEALSKKAEQDILNFESKIKLDTSKENWFDKFEISSVSFAVLYGIFFWLDFYFKLPASLDGFFLKIEVSWALILSLIGSGLFLIAERIHKK